MNIKYWQRLFEGSVCVWLKLNSNNYSVLIFRKPQYKNVQVRLRMCKVCVCVYHNLFRFSGDCFIDISRGLQNNITKLYNAQNHIYGENFKLKLCMCAQCMDLGSCKTFQLEILMISTIFAICIFRRNVFGSSWNVSETTHWMSQHLQDRLYRGEDIFLALAEIATNYSCCSGYLLSKVNLSYTTDREYHHE